VGTGYDPDPTGWPTTGMVCALDLDAGDSIGVTRVFGARR